MNPLREWAWQLYNKAARTVPNSNEARAVWNIHLAAGNATYISEARMKAAAASKKKQAEKQLVVSIAEMDTKTFALHFTHRHSESLANQDSLPWTMEFEVEQPYRAFHRRLHETLPYIEHEHQEESLESRVDRAIRCLVENHDFGWKELGDLNGHVAAFPDGQIATRVDGRIVHHDNVEDATDRILDAS